MESELVPKGSMDSHTSMEGGSTDRKGSMDSVKDAERASATLSELFTFKCDFTQDRNVTNMAWNKVRVCVLSLGHACVCVTRRMCVCVCVRRIRMCWLWGTGTSISKSSQRGWCCSGLSDPLSIPRKSSR